MTHSLISDICNMPVQLPYSPSASVVLGSAILGAMAHNEAERLGKKIVSQAEAEKSSFGMKERLWDLMVRHSLCARQPTATDASLLAQCRMSRAGSTIQPSASDKEKKLLDQKMKIFVEMIDLQRRWRKEVREALDEQ